MNKSVLTWHNPVQPEVSWFAEQRHQMTQKSESLKLGCAVVVVIFQRLKQPTARNSIVLYRQNWLQNSVWASIESQLAKLQYVPFLECVFLVIFVIVSGFYAKNCLKIGFRHKTLFLCNFGAIWAFFSQFCEEIVDSLFWSVIFTFCSLKSIEFSCIFSYFS